MSCVTRRAPAAVWLALGLLGCAAAATEAPSDGRPARLELVVAPAGVVSGEAFGTQPVVRVVDAAGRPLAASAGDGLLVRAALSQGSGQLGGVLESAVRDGRATFVGLGVAGTGAHALDFTLVDQSVPVLTAPIVVAPAGDGVRLLLGASSMLGARQAQLVEVPLLLDLSGRGTTDLSAITLRLAWDPTRLSYAGNEPGTWVDAVGGAASVTVNALPASTGAFLLSGFSVQPTTASFRLRTLRFTSLQPGSTPVNAVVTTAGASTGTTIPITVRNLDVRVLP